MKYQRFDLAIYFAEKPDLFPTFPSKLKDEVPKVQLGDLFCTKTRPFSDFASKLKDEVLKVLLGDLFSNLRMTKQPNLKK